MNQTGDGALSQRCRCCFFVLTLLVLQATPGLGAPKKPVAPVRRATPPPAAAVPAPLEWADAEPSPYRPPPADLLLSKADEKKADAMAAFIEGVLAEDNADMDKALENYRRAFDLDPTQTQLAIKIAYELARRGSSSVSEAINILKDAVKASPKDLAPYLHLTELYAKFLKKPDLALKYATQALEADPASLAPYLAIYEVHVLNGQPKKGEQILDRAANAPSTDPLYWLQLGDLYRRILLKPDGSGAPEDLKKMNALFQKALSLSGDDPTVLAKVADFYVLSQQLKQAIPLYLKVSELAGRAPDGALSNVPYKLALTLRGTGQQDEAIEVLEQMVKEDAPRFETYELLGQMWEEKGEKGEKGGYEKALAYYKKSLDLNRSQYLSYLHIAEMLLKLKMFDEAVDILKEARAQFPDLPQVALNLAIVLSQGKRHQEALTAFEETLRQAEATEAEVVNGAFYFSYGAAAEQAGEIEKAAELFKKSIEIDPTGKDQPSSPGIAYNYLGFMWVDRGENLDEAANLIRKALEMEPDNGAYLDSLGWYYFKKGDWQNAAVELQKAAERIQPEDPVVYDHLGDTYQQMGNAAQALVYWQKAAALDPEQKKILTKIESAKQKMTALPGPNPASPPPE